MGSSFYLQLSSYLLLEYTYGDSDSIYLSNQVKLARIKNNYAGGQIQFLNTSPSQNVTQNVLDTSAANLGGYKWAFLDKDVPVPYISQDANLVYTDLSSLLPSLYVTYDRVRIHILSGYRLDGLQGLLLQVYGREAQTSLDSILANNVFFNSDDRDILNPKPIILGDRMYDRYFEVLVPSIKEINKDYYANPTNPISVGYQYTSDNSGFLYETAIYVKVFEIDKLEKKNGNLFFYTGTDYVVNVNQEDTYSLLNANIQEASDGDYFSYYPTYDGNFIEEFIQNLDAAGGNYVIINDIDIYEQVGLENLMTFSFSQVQQSGFDGPLEFRPIVKYSESAVTFSIDYTVRIFNRDNGFQLIRKASTTSYSPKKYGKQLEKIALAQQSYPMKVYNKIAGSATIAFNTPTTNTGFNTVYVPIFYEKLNIHTQIKTMLAEGADPISPDFSNDIYFGQGDARIYLSDFDTYFKFSVTQLVPKTGATTKLDLISGEIQLSFKDLAGNFLKYSAQNSTPENSRAQGDLMFKIPGDVKKKVLGDNKDLIKNFYIVSSTPGNAETILYTGTVDSVENIHKETVRLQTVISNVTTSASGKSSAKTSSTSDQKIESITTPGKGPSILDTLTANNTENINTVKGTTEVHPTVIPGFSNDTKAVSVKFGVTPVSLQDESVSQESVNKKLSQQSGSETNLT
jgi:hypothetical protein